MTSPSSTTHGGRLEGKTRQLVARMRAGAFASVARDFDATLKEHVPPATLAATWSSLEAALGPCEEIESITEHVEGDHAIALATVKFARQRMVLRLTYDERDAIAGFLVQPVSPSVAWAAPSYANPDALVEAPVAVGTSPALPGLLTMPRAERSVPAMVLVHGSGPNDADETVGAVKPFKDLAYGLASRGIAVLRYVKRSKQSPAGIVTQKEEVLDGAHDAIALLRATPGIDPKRIYVLGHSQGGYLAPRIAQGNPGLAGLIILAGPARPMEDLLLDQLTYLSALHPDDSSLQPSIEAARAFKKLVASPELRAEESVLFPVGGGRMTGAYYLDVRGYDPPALAAQLSCRLLVLQGERDYQVTMRDFASWKQRLSASPNATLKSYPTLNHLFVSGTGTSTPADYDRAGQHVDAQVVADIAAWIDP